VDESQTSEAAHILAGPGLANGRVRVLKHGDTFAVFDEYGDIRSSQNGESGLYHGATRFLSRFQLELEGNRPFLLSSTVRDDNDQLVVALTNPDLCRDGHVYAPLGSLHLLWRKLLWKGALYQEMRVENHGVADVDLAIQIHFGADFADIYEVRGMRRKARGQDLDPEVTEFGISLAYRGLDGVVRRSALNFAPAPRRLTAERAIFDLALAPRQSASFEVVVTCERDIVKRPLLSFECARSEARADLESQAAQYCRIETNSGQFNALLRRAYADLHMLTTALPTGPYPYAGVPWFNTPFGRDGLITAMECLWVNPSLARGVLAYLAHTQATETNREQAAEPGKILHETRNGEMAALGEMPFARYYGTADATPLFVLLAGAYLERTGDLPLIEGIWRQIEAALEWMQRYGDCDGDGFIEYQGHARDGLLHQGWKDSDDAIFHADGSPACGPIALCEVQAYAFGAWQAAAELARALQLPGRSDEFSRRARALQERFERAFWCEDLSLYALALDGAKRPCRVRTSNAGQCLITGIASTDRALRIAQSLLRPESFSGWGIRTLAMGEPRYNPMGYHTGSVWPHDNALIAYGMSRYGIRPQVARVFTGFFDSAMACDLYRVPELFCGFPREQGEGPVPYPVACAPQAWSAAAVFLLLQSCLGLAVSAPRRKISFVRPSLPEFLSEVHISNLGVGDSVADLLVVRHEDDISVHVLRQEGQLEVVVLP
jgi:glycogen debranching enzyme